MFRRDNRLSKSAGVGVNNLAAPVPLRKRWEEPTDGSRAGVPLMAPVLRPSRSRAVLLAWREPGTRGLGVSDLIPSHPVLAYIKLDRTSGAAFAHV